MRKGKDPVLDPGGPKHADPDPQHFLTLSFLFFVAISLGCDSDEPVFFSWILIRNISGRVRTLGLLSEYKIKLDSIRLDHDAVN
jgi:hypothetical protein